MNNHVAFLLGFCILGILACAVLGALGPQGSWEGARWAGEKMWELVLILTGGKLALTMGDKQMPPGVEQRTVETTVASGPSVAQ